MDFKEESILHKISFVHSYFTLKEDDSTLNVAEQEKLELANKLRQKATNLLNLMDDIGMDALLEDDIDSAEFGGQAKEKVTVTEVLEALKQK